MKKLLTLFLILISIFSFSFSVFAKDPSEWIYNSTTNKLTVLVGSNNSNILLEKNSAKYVAYYIDPITNKETVSIGTSGLSSATKSIKDKFSNEYNITEKAFKAYGTDVLKTGVISIYKIEITKKEEFGSTLPENFKFYAAITKVNNSEYKGTSTSSKSDALTKLKSRLQQAYRTYYSITEDHSETSGYNEYIYYNITINNDKTYKGKTGKEISKTSNATNTNQSAITQNPYTIINSGVWKGSEGSYWFDQGNGKYPSGNKWYYITTDGGASGWANYYYWFDNEGYWRPQYYSENDPSLGYKEWGKNNGTSNNTSSNTQTNTNKNNLNNNTSNTTNTNTTSVISSNVNSAVNQNIENKSVSSSTALNNSGVNINTLSEDTIRLLQLDKEGVFDLSSSSIKEGSNSESEESSSNTNYGSDTINELFNEDKYTGNIWNSYGTYTFTKQEETGSNWEWTNLPQSLENWEYYTISNKVNAENKGAWAKGKDGYWYFITKAEEKATWKYKDKEKESTVNGAYVIEEILSDGSYAIKDGSSYKIYTFDEEGKCSGEPLKGNKGTIQLKSDGTISSGHEPEVDESVISIKIYEKEDTYPNVSSSKFYLSKDDNKNYTYLTDGYAILKKSDTSYSLYSISSTGKATSKSSGTLATIKKYIDKLGNNLEDAYEVEVKDGKESSSNTSNSVSNTISNALSTITYTLTTFANKSNITQDSNQLEFNLSNKTFLDKGLYYDMTSKTTITVNESGVVTNKQSGQKAGSIAGTYEIVKIDGVEFLVQ